MTKEKLYFIGDYNVPTGFATVVTNLLPSLEKSFDVTILATNNFSPSSGNVLPIGNTNRLSNELLDGVFGSLGKPDLICCLNDFWVLSSIAEKLSEVKRSYGYTPIDGKNVRSDISNKLNCLTGMATYTEFAKNELELSGVKNVKAVIPHGIRLDQFYPEHKRKLKKELFKFPDEWYIVGMVNRNQPRKRLDLSIQYFAEWVKRWKVDEAVKLYYHGALDDAGWDIEQLCGYYGISDRLILSSDKLKPGQGFPLKYLRAIYNILDVQISTAMAEGWGLTTMEGMACGVPQIITNWGGQAEWSRSAAYQIDCEDTMVASGNINLVCGIPNKSDYISALKTMYEDESVGRAFRERGLALAAKPEFRWENIGEKFVEFLSVS